jgi:hypothetical protein
MRYLLPLLIAIVLVGCAQNQSSFSQIAERTYQIESPPIPGGAEAPNMRVAQQLCPGGYRKLNETAHKGGPDRVDWYEHGTTTIWVVKCL